MVEYYSTIRAASQAIRSLALVFLFFSLYSRASTCPARDKCGGDFRLGRLVFKTGLALVIYAPSSSL
jgi:hypothetical protein